MEKDQHQSLLEAKPTLEPILVIDDDPHVLQMIQWVLEDEGFEVQTAADGQEALAQARQHRPVLVILDIGPPLLDGSHVAAELQAVYGMAVPIELITAMGTPHTRLIRSKLLRFCTSPSKLQTCCRRYTISSRSTEEIHA